MKKIKVTLVKHISPFRSIKGFTLIELLVVVLIIGILTAVAVPQYQKAVKKAEYVQNISIVRDLYDGLEMYRLEHGSYPPTPNGEPGGTINISYLNNLLDIEVETKSKQINYYPRMFIGYSGISINWGLGGGPGKGILLCNAHPTDSTYNTNKSICLSLCTDKRWHTWDHGEYCII